MTVTVTCSL